MEHALHVEVERAVPRRVVELRDGAPRWPRRCSRGCAARARARRPPRRGGGTCPRRRGRREGDAGAEAPTATRRPWRRRRPCATRCRPSRRPHEALGDHEADAALICRDEGGLPEMENRSVMGGDGSGPWRVAPLDRAGSWARTWCRARRGRGAAARCRSGCRAGPPGRSSRGAVVRAGVALDAAAVAQPCAAVVEAPARTSRTVLRSTVAARGRRGATWGSTWARHSASSA